MLSAELKARIQQYQQDSDDPIDNNPNNNLTGSLPTRKRSYPQDWPAYDWVKRHQKRLFKQLLIDLLLLAIEDRAPQQGPGRKGFDVRTKIFAMCIKIFEETGLRDAVGDLDELHEQHIIPAVPCFKSIDNFFNDETLSPLLDRLILLTALPLASIEDVAAMDSTCFTTGKYASHNEYKWGGVERKQIWRKLHAVVGTITNTFVSVEVTDSNVADATMLSTVVGNKMQYFQFSRFVADKAYLGRENLNFLGSVGLVPFIPFKKNSTGHARGSLLWSTMFEHFMRFRADFDEKYHQRSNVETCFWMVKQNFGHQVLTKHLSGNRNEIKTKVLCHNLCVLIHESVERGITPQLDACVKMLGRVQN